MSKRTNAPGSSSDERPSGGSFRRRARSLEGYGPALVIVVAIVAHLLMLNNSANSRFDGLYREMNSRLDRVVDQIAALDSEMEERFNRVVDQIAVLDREMGERLQRIDTKADERYDRMRADEDLRYDRMSAEADARYERYDARADARFDGLLGIVRNYEGRISSMETVLRPRMAE